MENLFENNTFEESYENTPVLLIGLGGIGSSIVDNVFGRLKESGIAENVEALVFDTDVGSQKKIVNVPNECKIQTSVDKTVGFVLDNIDQEAQEWFPRHPLVDKMNMLVGAGQIRAVSRIALRAAMKAGKLNMVDAIRERLFTVGTGAEKKGIRVMIVSSMMGGTGSGMFLQIPLYIREIFESQFSADRIEINGTFILPDVLKGSITPQQEDNVNANAYASMKELNAIIMSMAGDGSSIDLEYKPGQLNASGLRDIAVKDWPYDYCYFYDKENTKGNVLGGFDDYISMIENNLYLQVFGPISDRMYSNYINEIRSAIRENGRNIYGGIGAGEIDYPYDDIVDFCVYKVLLESMDNQLLKIDKIYRLEMDKYNRDIQQGIAAVKPDREQVYITNFESLATTDNFFMQIKRSITEYDDNGNPVLVGGQELTNIFKLKAAIDANVDALLKNDREILDAANQCQFRPGDIVNLPNQKLVAVVSNLEAKYRQYRMLIESKSQAKAETKAKADWGVYGETAKSILDDFIHSVQTPDNYVNSVGIRYMLYKLHYQLKNEKLMLEDQNQKATAMFQRFENMAFDGKAGGKMDPVRKANEVVKDTGLFGKSLKKFKEDYERLGVERKKLNAYCTNMLKAYYYDTSLQLLEALMNEYEQMFTRLSDQKYDVEKTIQRLLVKHDDTKGTTNIYVLANHTYKEQIWRTIPEDVKANILTGTLSEEMHKALFASFQQKVNSAIGQSVSYDKLFHELIFTSCRNRLLNNSIVRENLDINIMQALEKEASFNGRSEDRFEYIKDRLSDLADTVCPWAPKSENCSDFNIWGISNECKMVAETSDDEMTLKNLIEDASQGKFAATNVEIDKKHILSKRKIYFVTSRYGLMVSDFAKFSAGKNDIPDGDYFVAYNKVISALLENKAITPHIDKRWHLTLRDINDEVVRRNLADIAKSFIVGLAEEKFKVNTTSDGTNINRFVSQFEAGVSVISYQGAPINGKLVSLHDALSGNPNLVAKVNTDIFAPYISNLRANPDPNKDVLDCELVKKLNNISILGYDRVNNILDVLFNYSTEMQQDDNSINILMSSLLDVVDKIAWACAMGSEDKRSLNTNRILQSLLASSSWEKELDKTSMAYSNIFGVILNKIS